jgi:hypothetical protein
MQEPKTKEQEYILSGNELMALFDGWVQEERKNVICYTRNGYLKYDYELEYHKDWNKLIEVWYKFRDLTFENITHQFMHSDIKNVISHRICYEGINPTYKKIVLAIQWYNTTKQ